MVIGLGFGSVFEHVLARFLSLDHRAGGSDHDPRDGGDQPEDREHIFARDEVEGAQDEANLEQSFA